MRGRSLSLRAARAHYGVSTGFVASTAYKKSTDKFAPNDNPSNRTRLAPPDESSTNPVALDHRLAAPSPDTLGGADGDCPGLTLSLQFPRHGAPALGAHRAAGDATRPRHGGPRVPAYPLRTRAARSCDGQAGSVHPAHGRDQSPAARAALDLQLQRYDRALLRALVREAR